MFVYLFLVYDYVLNYQSWVKNCCMEHVMHIREMKPISVIIIILLLLLILLKISEKMKLAHHRKELIPFSWDQESI